MQQPIGPIGGDVKPIGAPPSGPPAMPAGGMPQMNGPIGPISGGSMPQMQMPSGPPSAPPMGAGPGGFSGMPPMSGAPGGMSPPMGGAGLSQPMRRPSAFSVTRPR